MQITVDGEVITRTDNEEGFKMLGTMLTLDNNFEVEIEHRVARAWAAYSTHRELITYRPGSLKKRLKLLDMIVSSALFWGAGAWNLTTKQEMTLPSLRWSRGPAGGGVFNLIGLLK